RSSAARVGSCFGTRARLNMPSSTTCGRSGVATPSSFGSRPTASRGVAPCIRPSASRTPLHWETGDRRRGEGGGDSMSWLVVLLIVLLALALLGGGGSS